MTILRPYQTRAVHEVLRLWRDGVRRVLLVAPTGAGKTVMAQALGNVPAALWMIRGLDLVEQTRQRVPNAQVWSIDTLLARGNRPQADFVVLDEAHHAAADTYPTVLAAYSSAKHLGLTATPQRRDGRALGEHYDRLVVAATYRELLASGDIVPCRVRRPAEYLGSGVARSPLDEWKEFGDGRQTFAFAGSVEDAKRFAAEFRAAGIKAAAVDGETPEDIRAAYLQNFRAGYLQVLWNVYVLTEGVDIPAVSCILLASNVTHAGGYLQRVGRGLRPAEGKVDCILLDMPGVSHVHGLPTADREYSLDGRPIRVVGEPLKNCPQCGACIPSAQNPCPECNFEWVPEKRKLPKIYNVALQWVTDATELEGVPEALRRDEWRRLLGLVETRGWAVGFAKKEYEKLFGVPVPAAWLTDAAQGVQERELAKLMATAKERGYRKGWVAFRYKSMFGQWPRRMG